MSRTDALISKLNLNSPQFDSPGVSGITGLDPQAVHAALGMGNLSKECHYLGLIVHMKDDAMRKPFRRYGMALVGEIFQEQGWSSTKPFIRRFKSWIESGALKEKDLPAEKAKYSELFQQQLMNLAIAQLQADGDCLTCNGTGYLRPKTIDGVRQRPVCPTCHGSRKHKWFDEYCAGLCFLELHQWKQTWKSRYQLVLNDLTPWLHEFEDHLERHY